MLRGLIFVFVPKQIKKAMGLEGRVTTSYSLEVQTAVRKTSLRGCCSPWTSQCRDCETSIIKDCPEFREFWSPEFDNTLNANTLQSFSICFFSRTIINKTQITSLVKRVACHLKLTGLCAFSFCVLDTSTGAGLQPVMPPGAVPAIA